MLQPQGIAINVRADFVPYELQVIHSDLISLDLQPQELIDNTIADIIFREPKDYTVVVDLNVPLRKYINLDAINSCLLNEIASLNTNGLASEMLGSSDPDNIQLG